jgi:hypothetical protein
MRRRLAIAIWTVWSLASGGFAASNLVVNGSFDRPGDPLSGWRYKYELDGDSWYFDNHKYVKVVDREDQRSNVLSLWGNYELLQVPGQGVKVDSKPIPVKPGKRYRVSCQAKSTGPDCRILVEAYRWNPGIKPHPDPEHWELRRCYKFSQLYFGAKEEGTMGGVGRAWKRASQVIPETKVSAMAKEHLDRIQFYVIHIVAIGGSEGNLFVDDVAIEELR